MKPIHAQAGVVLALTFALGGCVPKPRPAPPVQTRPMPAPAPAPAPAPIYDSWMDAPQTPGDWSYRAQSKTALFGEGAGAPLFTMRCDPATDAVILSRMAQSAGAARMIVRTESQTRSLAAVVAGPAVEARLAANDRLLDAMALSKGRFAVEVPGAPALYLPSWAEVTRVIEDCR